MSRRLLEAYFAALNARDWEAFEVLLAHDVRYEVPQTGEVVRGPAKVAAFNRKFPGKWSIEAGRALANETVGMAELEFRDGKESQRAVVVHEYREGKITRITDYWPAPYDPPAFRADWPEIEREGSGRSPAPARQNVAGTSPWEAAVGYSRAVRVGNVVHVAGTTATVGGEVVCVGDAYGQARVALEIIAGALEAAGAGLEHVVRTRIYVTDISQWEAVGRAHGEVFGHIRPAASMVGVAALIDPRHLVEIEAEAILPGGA